MARFLALHKKNRIVTKHGFTSASTKAAIDSPDVLSLIYDKGVGREVSKLSLIPRQREVLYPSGTIFHVEDVIDTKDDELTDQQKQLIDSYGEQNGTVAKYIVVMTTDPDAQTYDAPKRAVT